MQLRDARDGHKVSHQSAAMKPPSLPKRDGASDTTPPSRSTDPSQHEASQNLRRPRFRKGGVRSSRGTARGLAPLVSSLLSAGRSARGRTVLVCILGTVLMAVVLG